MNNQGEYRRVCKWITRNKTSKIGGNSEWVTGSPRQMAKDLVSSEKLLQSKWMKNLRESLLGRWLCALENGIHHRKQWMNHKNWKTQGPQLHWYTSIQVVLVRAVSA